MDATDLGRIRPFVASLLGEHDDHEPFSDTESLIKVNPFSLSVVELVTFLESDFEVDLGEVEFDPRRLDSVYGIAALVEQYRALR